MKYVTEVFEALSKVKRLADEAERQLRYAPQNRTNPVCEKAALEMEMVQRNVESLMHSLMWSAYVEYCSGTNASEDYAGQFEESFPAECP